MPTPRASYKAGFTLLEVLTVMVVASILMLIMMPKIDLARFQLDAAMREVGSAVAAGRGRAILRQHDFVLMFDESGFVMLDDLNNNGKTDPGEENGRSDR